MNLGGGGVKIPLLPKIPSTLGPSPKAIRIKITNCDILVAADVSQDELEELQRLVGQEEKARLAKSPALHTAHFSGSAHFYEQVVILLNLYCI